MTSSYAKNLTENDTGETGGHQGGITVPRKDSGLLVFFPNLDLDTFNPEAWIECEDPEGRVWKMRYVYYNGKTFSPKKSTRNEYRITYMTKFFRHWRVASGDQLIFTETDNPTQFKISINKVTLELSKLADNTVPTAVPPVLLRGWSRIY